VGQQIEIEGARIVDDSIILTTNRSLTGTQGEGYASAEEASGSGTFAAKLATELFESDDRIERVYVSSNVVVVKRGDGWPEGAEDTTERVVQEFFLYYPAA